MNRLRSQAERAASEIRKAFPAIDSPVVMLQLGVGFDPEGLFDRKLGAISLNDLPDMPSAPSPAGHPLELSLGECGDSQVLLAHGRRHLYEGYGAEPCVAPVCAAFLCGVRNFVFVSVAAGIHEEFKPGSWVFLTDYINNLGASPLVGNPGIAADFFPDMTEAFSQELTSQLINAGSRAGLTPRLGTYQANLGPQLETPAEADIARSNGADVVGASIVLETIVARAMGARAAGAALVTHRAAVHGARPVRFADVAQDSRLCSPPLMQAVRLFARGETAPAQVTHERRKKPRRPLAVRPSGQAEAPSGVP